MITSPGTADSLGQAQGAGMLATILRFKRRQTHPEQRHYCHRYVLGIEKLLDEGLLDAVLKDEKSEPKKLAKTHLLST